MKELVQIVEIQMPRCSLSFGQGACTASAGAGLECFNTLKTCQDTGNYDQSFVSLYFSSGSLSDADVADDITVWPFVSSVNTIPSSINFAGASSNKVGIGTRASLTIKFIDPTHSDNIVDPYAGTRAYDARALSTFWLKLLTRQPYWQDMKVVIYEGEAGQSLSEMSTRTYFTSDMSWPTGGVGSSVTLTARDKLTQIMNNKVMIPETSSGILYVDINESRTSFVASNAVRADYDASGYLRIGDEIMEYKSRVNDANGVKFRGVTRGAFGTEASEHSLESTVQQCIYYPLQSVNDVVEDLLLRAGVEASELDRAGWDVEEAENIAGYRVSNLLSEPKSCDEVLSNIMEQTLVSYFWDEFAAKVKMSAVRGYASEPDTLTQESHFMKGVTVSQKTDERISQLFYGYGRTDYIASRSEITAYPNYYFDPDFASESADAYNSSKVRYIYADWVSSVSMARDISSRYIKGYKDTPREFSFSLDNKDEQLSIGDVVFAELDTNIDFYGNRERVNLYIISTDRVEKQGKVSYTAKDVTSYGRYYFWMADDAPDYDGTRDFKSAYWGDEDGLLSDGTIGATWG